ncbi:unnamed protein product [Microthlaspi erraticum]|uniref:Arabidopsis retrotransposon Orf1 C-terminal domain-containing protein n=1 Tax=Microthlaspi erraticum TaxID=1685480 RepID=A0A6D2J210_9BRAS|nr:unnamed protein product [Microthlaspi erraticum]
MVTFRQLEILFGFTMEKVTMEHQGRRTPKSWATIAEEGSCQHLLCKESHWTINEGEVKLLDMGIKPIISRTRMGRRSEEIGHTQGISCLSLSSSTYKVTAYNTRHQRGRKLSVGGVITPILCAAGVQVDKRRSTPPGWMDIKFCKTNLLIEHKELDGRFQFKFTPIGWTLQASSAQP